MEDSDVKNDESKSISVPELLKTDHRGNLIQSITMMLKKITLSIQQNEDLSTFKRIIKVLIRGISSKNTVVQRNYLVALEIIIQQFKSSSWFSLKYIIEAVEEELHISKNTSKGEEGEILLGKVLVFGALVRSEALINTTEDEVVTLFSGLLQDLKARSYLPLIADIFLILYLKQIDMSVMKKTVWPLLQKEVFPGPNQPLVIYHTLLVAEELFPSVVNKKYLQQALGCPRVLSTTTVPGLVTALQNNFNPRQLNHPLYTDIFKYLISAPEDVLQSFWKEVDTQLLVESSTATTKPIMAITFFTLIVSHLENASQVSGLLTPNLVSWFTRKHKINKSFHKKIQQSCKEALNKLCVLCSKPDSSKSVFSVINKLMFDPGTVLFDVNSGTRVVHQLLTRLPEKGVMKLASKLRDVIVNTSSFKQKNTALERPWHNTERLHVTHVFCNLLALPVMQSNLTWRLDQLIFLFDLGFFPTSNVGVELAGLIRESFYSCLNQKLPNLVDLRKLLGGIIKHVNTRLETGDELRVKLSAEVITAWKKMSTTAEQIGEEKKYKNEQWVTSVFQTMFYHIGLHLFKEAKFASDVLQELHSVYERVSKGRGKGKVEDEPHWTEVVVEMILSLLSRNSQLHRHLIGCIFSHFCPLMTPQNIHQILQVLDPSNNSNPLLSSLNSDSESSSGDEDMDSIEDEGEAEEEWESSDDGMSDDVEEDVDEKANDKLRRAVFEALGDNGALTDVESVDLDEMDEAEASRVDRALSEAFRANRQTKVKKPTAYAKTLMNFRIRVLDLVEMWIISEPPLDLLVDTLLGLITLLEHALVDRHQAPLEARVRAVIRKLTSTRKYNVSECKTLPLGNILKSLLEKGNRTTTVYMSIVHKELTAATVFLVKASQHVPEQTDSDGPAQVTIYRVLKDTINNFFRERDCLLTVELFQRVFQQNAPYIVNLASLLPNYAFDSSVHPFRRCKALEFLLTFCKCNRILLDTNKEHINHLMNLSTLLYKGSIKMMKEPSAKIQPKFMILLKRAFELIRKKNWMSDIDWKKHIEKLLKFQKSLVTKKEKKSNAQKPTANEGNEIGKIKSEDDSSTDENLDQNLPSTPPGELKEDDSSNTEETQDNYQEKTSISIKSEKKLKNKSFKNQSNLPQENGNRSSDSEEEAPVKSDKKTTKRSHAKSKRAQLLKNNSKQMRLASLAEGLEENIFSQYNLLTKKRTPVSP